jgi:hypothetical protein
MSRFKWVRCRVAALAVPCLISACSADEFNGGRDESNGGGDESNGGRDDALLSQTPHCQAGETALRIEGSIAGSTVNDQRSTNISVHLTTSVTSTFDSPAGNVFGNLVPKPQPSEIEIHLKWAGSVSVGQTSPTTGGNLVAPAGTAYAGQTLCITQGAIGFGEGGSEDGVFKFKVSELRAAADCQGEVLPVELRGCYGSQGLSD